MFTTTTAVLFAMASSVFGQDTDYIHCETSGGSPIASDCQVALDNFDTNRCYGTNSIGSGCTDWTTASTCKIVGCISNADSTAGSDVAGFAIKNAAEWLIGNCTNGDGLAGGYFHYAFIPTANQGSTCEGEKKYVHVELVKK